MNQSSPASSKILRFLLSTSPLGPTNGRRSLFSCAPGAIPRSITEFSAKLPSLHTRLLPFINPKGQRVQSDGLEEFCGSTVSTKLCFLSYFSTTNANDNTTKPALAVYIASCGRSWPPISIPKWWPTNMTKGGIFYKHVFSSFFENTPAELLLRPSAREWVLGCLRFISAGSRVTSTDSPR